MISCCISLCFSLGLFVSCWVDRHPACELDSEGKGQAVVILRQHWVRQWPTFQAFPAALPLPVLPSASPQAAGTRFPTQARSPVPDRLLLPRATPYNLFCKFFISILPFPLDNSSGMNCEGERESPVLIYCTRTPSFVLTGFKPFDIIGRVAYIWKSGPECCWRTPKTIQTTEKWKTAWWFKCQERKTS